jgi:hypothetical protein
MENHLRKNNLFHLAICYGRRLMPRGSSAKREKEYEKLKEEFKEEGRYEGREEEVAARIVNKQRAEYGETKEQKAEEKRGQSPDRNLPIERYRHLTIKEVQKKLDSLSESQIKQIKEYEKRHKNRKTLIAEIDRRLNN